MRNLSRFTFISGAGTAFLASCSGNLDSIPSGALSAEKYADARFRYGTSLQRPTYTVATSGLKMSSSPSGHAFASFLSNGSMFSSIAFAGDLMRITSMNGTKQVFSLTRLQPYYRRSVVAGDTSKVRFATLASGQFAGVIKKNGQRTLLHLGNDMVFYIRSKSGSANGLSMGTGIVPGTSAQEAFNSLMTSIGTWNGDNDFTLGAAEAFKAARRTAETERRGRKGHKRALAGLPGTGADDHFGDQGFGDGDVLGLVDNGCADLGDGGDDFKGDVGYYFGSDKFENGGDTPITRPGGDSIGVPRPQAGADSIPIGGDIFGPRPQAAGGACVAKKKKKINKTVCDRDQQIVNAAVEAASAALMVEMDVCIGANVNQMACLRAAYDSFVASQAVTAALAQAAADGCKVTST